MAVLQDAHKSSQTPWHPQQSNRTVNSTPAQLKVAFCAPSEQPCIAATNPDGCFPGKQHLTAVPTRFELAVSSLTGTHVGPLHHGTWVATDCTGVASTLANRTLNRTQRRYHRFLPQRQRQIAPRLFQDAAGAVGRPPQAACERVWIVQCHEQRVDVVHRL